jgi:uncharacterized protein (TIGR02996 family)
MTSDETFLRAILRSPGDRLTRLVYADWLEERGDPRARYVRADSDAERINYIDWLRRRNRSLDYYIERFPEVARQIEEWPAREKERRLARALPGWVSPAWVAFMDSLGRPFEPYLFWNNGTPQAFQPEELPFSRRVGTRGSVITFEGEFESDESWDPGLPKDLLFLTRLDLSANCAYGAASCPVYPFLCELAPGRGPAEPHVPASGREQQHFLFEVASGRSPLTGVDVVVSLKARDFRSEHIAMLDATEIPWPGYHHDTANDEVHTEFACQSVFQREEADESSGTHGELKRYVDGRLWYVLLHPPERPCNYVVLFVVGRSPHGERLLGVVTHQVCHNLCD